MILSARVERLWAEKGVRRRVGMLFVWWRVVM